MADTLLAENLDAFGAVLIEGPKWCGKTTTAEQIAKSRIWIEDPDNREKYEATAQAAPSMLLQGEKPRLIDEWQDIPVLWDSVRMSVDRSDDVGLYILTGSVVVDRAQIKHTGTGRIEKMRMYPMSLYESGESNGRISIHELFDNPAMDIDGIESALTVPELIFATCRGGWPGTFKLKSDKSKLKIAQSYFKSICDDDISRVDGVTRNPVIARQVLKSYARNISTLAKKTSMMADVKGVADIVDEKTFDDYVGALRKLFILEDIDGWCPSIRSATALRSGLKREFVDPSIAIAALNLSPESFQTDLKTFGFFFENLCVRDLRAYTQPHDSHLSYYRDRYGLESDVVLHLPDDRYALIECKLGSREIDEGANHLIEIKRLITEHNVMEKQVVLREPDLLIVLTGGQMAYTRNDGVKVIPLSCLKD